MTEIQLDLLLTAKPLEASRLLKQRGEETEVDHPLKLKNVVFWSGHFPRDDLSWEGGCTLPKNVINLF